jgi:hypothetical protein
MQCFPRQDPNALHYHLPFTIRVEIRRSALEGTLLFAFLKSKFCKMAGGQIELREYYGDVEWQVFLVPQAAQEVADELLADVPSKRT